MKDQQLNCYIIEEHNEAFSVWIKAINRQELNPYKNVLLHVDDHSDMTPMRFNETIRPIYDLDDVQLDKFTRDNISIASFIIASCFLKIFDVVRWIQIGGAKVCRETYVTTFDNDYKNIIAGAFSPNNPLLSFDHHVFKYETYDQNEDGCYIIGKDNDLVLDIDLDYFSCEINPDKMKEVVLEISRSEFEEFNKDPYHRIRYLVDRVTSTYSNGKYYLILNYYQDILPSPRKVDTASILARLDNLEHKLAKMSKKPKLITICRSRISGYTPSDQWSFIENELIKMLNRQFNKLKVNYPVTR